MNALLIVKLLNFKIDDEQDTRPTKFTRASDPELDSARQNVPPASSASAPISISLSNSKADNTDTEVTGGKTHAAALRSLKEETTGREDAENEDKAEAGEEPNTRTEPTIDDKGSTKIHEQTEGGKHGSRRAQQTIIDQHRPAKGKAVSMIEAGTKDAEVSDQDESPPRALLNKSVASVGAATHTPAMSPLAKVRSSFCLL